MTRQTVRDRIAECKKKKEVKKKKEEKKKEERSKKKNKKNGPIQRSTHDKVDRNTA